ncbi:MAG: hypothetical protein K2Y29_02700 [Beijerinckiaceae bacterium]|nr:hypothetical protein [Beijerinckiaceae bacterium]
MALAVRPPPGRDPLVRMLVINWIMGACMGVAFAAVLLAADVAGMRSLIMGTDLAIPALALLFGGFAITFGGVIAATAVMLMNDKDDDRDGGHGFQLRPIPVRVPVRVRARR